MVTGASSRSLPSGAGEPDQPLSAILVEVIDAGVRPSFEMEQVLPGVDEDDWDSDPIVEAVDLYRAGLHRDAMRVLDDLLAIDRRCVDATTMDPLLSNRNPRRGRPEQPDSFAWTASPPIAHSSTTPASRTDPARGIGSSPDERR